MEEAQKRFSEVTTLPEETTEPEVIKTKELTKPKRKRKVVKAVDVKSK